jgi:hypothetical protein
VIVLGLAVAAIAVVIFYLVAVRRVPSGGDFDEHGCKGSTGATWCEKERACVRSWELAKEKGFPNTVEGYAAYCGR